MGILDNLSDTKVYGNSKYFRPGQYIVKLTNMEEFWSTKEEINYMKIEGEVCATTADVSNDLIAAPGESAAQVFKSSGSKQNEDRAKANWMNFLCGIFTMKIPDLNDEQWASTSKNVLDGEIDGMYVYLYTWDKPLKSDSKKNYTVHEWHPMTPARWEKFGIAIPAGAQAQLDEVQAVEAEALAAGLAVG